MYIVYCETTSQRSAQSRPIANCEFVRYTLYMNRFSNRGSLHSSYIGQK